MKIEQWSNRALQYTDRIYYKKTLQLATFLFYSGQMFRKVEQKHNTHHNHKAIRKNLPKKMFIKYVKFKAICFS